MMDANDGHLLPDLSFMLGIPVEMWMWLFNLVSALSRSTYCFKTAWFMVEIMLTPITAERPLWLVAIVGVMLEAFFPLVLPLLGK